MVALKFTYSYWFVIIFFTLRKIPNISYYFFFVCFILFFQYKKISYIFSYVVSFFFFLPSFTAILDLLKKLIKDIAVFLKKKNLKKH